MKKIILFTVLLFAFKSFSQTNGITYQALILNPNSEDLPGVNNTNSPMVNKNICIQFQITDPILNLEYKEVFQTRTDSFGMVNLVIGLGIQTGGFTTSFSDIDWSSMNKNLVVSIDPNGSCTQFTTISNQTFTAVPFSYSATNADNVTGIVAIKNGGTNATTVLEAKTNLGIESVDNTSDANKPISMVAQTALDLKANLASPILTGSPTAPTAVAGTNTSQLATTSFVNTAVTSALRDVADEFTATAAQTSFILTQTPATNSKVEMFINGIRISNIAYSISETILTYVPTNNGGYTLTVNDRIQFDYFY